MQIANLWHEDPVPPVRERLTETQRLKHLSGSRCVVSMHQKINVGHRPLTGAIEAHGVQRRTLQTYNRDSFPTATRSDLIQQFLDPAMTGSHVGLLTCQEV